MGAERREYIIIKILLSVFVTTSHMITSRLTINHQSFESL